MTNKKIIEQFELLIKQVHAEFLNAKIENDVKETKMHQFRLKNLKNVLKIIKDLDYKITSADDLEGIKGIGKGTLTRITEILEKGHLSELHEKYENKKQKIIDSIQELEGIIGIGSKIAKKIVTEHKIKSVVGLRKAVKKGTITLNDKILLGLKYYGIVKGNIPREEIKLIKKYLDKVVELIDPKLELTICGSYRRGKSTSNDIDVLLVHPDLSTIKQIKDPKKYGFDDYLQIFVKKLEKKKFILDHMTDKNYTTKYMGICQYKNDPVRRIDIRIIAYSSLPTALLHYTGPFELNQLMRTEAKKRGMLLNEYGLYKLLDDGEQKIIKITSEEDVFKKLGMDYLSPVERENFNVGKNKRF